MKLQKHLIFPFFLALQPRYQAVIVLYWSFLSIPALTRVALLGNLIWDRKKKNLPYLIPVKVAPLWKLVLLCSILTHLLYENSQYHLFSVCFGPLGGGNPHLWVPLANAVTSRGNLNVTTKLFLLGTLLLCKLPPFSDNVLHTLRDLFSFSVFLYKKLIFSIVAREARTLCPLKKGPKRYVSQLISQAWKEEMKKKWNFFWRAKSWHTQVKMLNPVWTT